MDDVLTISAEGAVQARSKMFGEAAASLNEMQKLQLATLFENWRDLKDEYPSPKPSGKPAMEEIQFGDKKVVVADDAENIPEELSRVRQKLAGMLAELVRK